METVGFGLKNNGDAIFDMGGYYGLPFYLGISFLYGKYILFISVSRLQFCHAHENPM